MKKTRAAPRPYQTSEAIVPALGSKQRICRNGLHRLTADNVVWHPITEARQCKACLYGSMKRRLANLMYVGCPVVGCHRAIRRKRDDPNPT